MPSASNYTNKIRFAASVKNTKAQLVGGVANGTQGSISGCGLDIQYGPINYVIQCPCPIGKPIPPLQLYITTVVGTGVVGGLGDGGPAISATIGGSNICFDSQGNLYIADGLTHRIRKVDNITGIITTIAGNGVSGFSGDGGPALSCNLNNPQAVAVDSSGNLYIADTDNYRIRKVNSATSIITTITGRGIPAFGGDGGPATSAYISISTGIALDSDRNVYIADTDNQRIRKINSTTGIITTIVGNGVDGFSGDGGPATSSSLNYPEGVFLDSQGNVYIADTYNNRIRKVDNTTGIITTIVGNGQSRFSGDGGPAINSSLRIPHAVCMDSDGNVYISDSNNHSIRKVDNTTGIITTISGNGAPGFSGDGGPAKSSRLNYPQGIAIDPTGNIYIGDSNNGRIRKLYYP